MSILLTAPVTGLKQIMKSLEKADKDQRNALAAALYQEGFAIMAESKKECPVRYGLLKGSGYVAPPSPRDTEPIVELGYGKEYAAAVHDVQAPHRVGKWRYLRDPINRAQAGYTRRIQRRTKANLRSGTTIGGVSPEQPKRPEKNRREP